MILKTAFVTNILTVVNDIMAWMELLLIIFRVTAYFKSMKTFYAKIVFEFVACL